MEDDQSKVMAIENLFVPIDAGGRTVVHRLLNFFIRGAGRVENFGLAVVMIVRMIFSCTLHSENLRAGLGTNFTSDATLLVNYGYACHYWTFLVMLMIYRC